MLMEEAMSMHQLICIALRDRSDQKGCPQPDR